MSYQPLHARQTLKKKLRNREKTFGAWTSLAHPSITEMFARIGVDFIGIDIEHSTINQEQAQRIIAASQSADTPCLPRIASHNVEMTRRLLDSGADGIIVPMISSRKQGEDVVRWLKYPPKGERGFGIARGQGYGFDFEEYTTTWNAASSIIVQIESIQGVEQAEDILSQEDIDGAIVGPYDISGSLGVPGQLDHPLVREASQKVIEACARYGKGCGTQIVQPDRSSIQRAFASGYTCIILASDVFLLWKWSETMRDVVTALHQE